MSAGYVVLDAIAAQIVRAQDCVCVRLGRVLCFVYKEHDRGAASETFLAVG